MTTETKPKLKPQPVNTGAFIVGGAVVGTLGALAMFFWPGPGIRVRRRRRRRPWQPQRGGTMSLGA